MPDCNRAAIAVLLSDGHDLPVIVEEAVAIGRKGLGLAYTRTRGRRESASARAPTALVLTELVVRVVEDRHIPREAVEINRAAPDGDLAGLDAGKDQNDG